MKDVVVKDVAVKDVVVKDVKLSADGGAERPSRPLRLARLHVLHQLHVLHAPYQPRTFAKINGATIVASDSTMYDGVSGPSLPHVIFSFGTAPEYEP